MENQFTHQKTLFSVKEKCFSMGAISHFRTCRLLKPGNSYASLYCDAPPDKSKQLRLIHVIYENDGIVAGNVKKSISMRDVSDFRDNFAKLSVRNLQKVPN